MPVFAFYFAGYGVARAAITELRIWGRPFGFWVATLHHEIFDDTVEQYAVVEPLIHQFDEIFAVLFLCGVEGNDHVAHGGFYRYARPIGWRGRIAVVFPALGLGYLGYRIGSVGFVFGITSRVGYEGTCHDHGNGEELQCLFQHGFNITICD